MSNITNTPNTTLSYGKVTANNAPITPATITADNGTITANNGAGNEAVTVRYIVQCKEPNIYQEFSDFDTAHTFATQLAQDYPQAHIEKAKVSLFFNDWDNDNGGQV